MYGRVVNGELIHRKGVTTIEAEEAIASSTFSKILAHVGNGRYFQNLSCSESVIT